MTSEQQDRHSDWRSEVMKDPGLRWFVAHAARTWLKPTPKPWLCAVYLPIHDGLVEKISLWCDSRDEAHTFVKETRRGS